jgi:hypothetical protein
MYITFILFPEMYLLVVSGKVLVLDSTLRTHPQRKNIIADAPPPPPFVFIVFLSLILYLGYFLPDFSNQD